jgi:hypothetical protein
MFRLPTRASHYNSKTPRRWLTLSEGGSRLFRVRRRLQAAAEYESVPAVRQLVVILHHPRLLKPKLLVEAGRLLQTST